MQEYGGFEFACAVLYRYSTRPFENWDDNNIIYYALLYRYVLEYVVKIDRCFFPLLSDFWLFGFGRALFSPAAGAVCGLEVVVGGARRGARPPWP